MKALDHLLMRWRFRVALPWIPPGAAVLDIGCHQGELLKRLGERLGHGIGFDPLALPRATGRYRLHAEVFPIPSLLPAGSFDAVVMLATLEHIRDKAGLPGELARLLRLGGRVVITVPSPFVDRIVHWLCRLRIADGMSVEEHHGFLPQEVGPLFGPAGFRLLHHTSFQLGLNHLFVFSKAGDP